MSRFKIASWGLVATLFGAESGVLKIKMSKD
jgi:hypothetical protein